MGQPKAPLIVAAAGIAVALHPARHRRPPRRHPVPREVLADLIPLAWPQPPWAVPAAITT
mgnify:CR=1 FL=1